MTDLNDVFRDQPIQNQRSGKFDVVVDWIKAELSDILPKKRDKTKPRSVLDAPQGPLEWARRIIGYFYFDGERAVGAIADGDRFSPKSLKRGGTLYEVTWPCKAVSIFLTCLIIKVTYDMHMMDLARGQTPETLTALIIVGPILAYVLTYQWKFKVRLFDDKVTLMNGYFQTKTYNLSDIVHIANSKGGGYTLHLADGKTVGIFKYVNGHSELIERLETAAQA